MVATTVACSLSFVLKHMMHREHFFLRHGCSFLTRRTYRLPRLRPRFRTGIGWALLSVLFLAHVAPAQETENAYDLAACIRAALANDPDLQAAAAEIRAARAQLAEASSGRLGEGEYRQILGFVPEAKGDILDPPKENRQAVLRNLGPFTQLEVMFHFPLWTFGKLQAALEAAQNGLEAQRAQGEQRKAEVVLSVKRLYYGALLADQLAATLDEMLDNMDKAIRKVEERLARGSTSVTEIDLLKLKTGRAKLAKGVAEVRASASFTRAALARAIGVDLRTPLRLVDRKLQPVPVKLASVDAYLEEGLQQRPEVQQLTRGVAAQVAKVELEEAQLFPTFFLSTGFQYAAAPNRTTQRNPFAQEDFNYARPVGVLGVQWELDFARKAAKVEQARAELARLQAQQRAALSGLQLEIRKAYGEVVQAQETMTAAEEGRRAGRSLLVLTVSNFDLGIGEAEELFKGLSAYTEASTDYFRAVHDFNVAVAQLSRAVGRELTLLQY